MAQHLLHRAEIGTAFQHVSCESVAEGVRTLLLVDLGTQIAQQNSRDTVNRSITQSNGFGPVSVIKRGFQQVMIFSDIEMDDLRQLIPTLGERRGASIWILWDPGNYPLECVFGPLEWSDVAYTNVLHGDLTLTVRGLA